MRTFHLLFMVMLSALFFSCENKDHHQKKYKLQKDEILEPEVDVNEFDTSFIKWWTYYYYNTPLSSNFTGLTEQSDTIEKRQFLEELMTGNYIPLRLKSTDKSKIYKLFRLNPNPDNSIKTTIKNESLISLKHLNMEGLPLPEFKFTDLNGNTYTNENTRGKTVILKTWYINCAVCITEIPKLNELVENYSKRKDILFVSLALDEKNKLEQFLLKKSFDYQIVPKQREFIGKKLKLQAYPSHLVIDENGIIIKVTNKASEMIEFLEMSII